MDHPPFTIHNLLLLIHLPLVTSQLISFVSPEKKKDWSSQSICGLISCERARRDMEDLDKLKATELTLSLPGTDAPEKPTPVTPRVINKRTNEECCTLTGNRSKETAAPAAKAQVVGWPPVRSYRMNSFRARKMETEDNTAIYVKVSMDGAPYLRKVDLRVYKSYKELMEALDDMFKCFSLLGSGEGHDESEYAITYEDKDGDWMLVGDVPWEMFISSCKRLRIMKGSEARGLSSSP